MFQVGADVLPPEPVQETRLVHHEQRLGMRSAQNQMFLAPAQPFVEVLERIKSRGINRQDFSQAENEHLRLLSGPFQRRFQLVRRAKEE